MSLLTKARTLHTHTCADHTTQTHYSYRTHYTHTPHIPHKDTLTAHATHTTQTTDTFTPHILHTLHMHYTYHTHRTQTHTYTTHTIDTNIHYMPHIDTHTHTHTHTCAGQGLLWRNRCSRGEMLPEQANPREQPHGALRGGEFPGSPPGLAFVSPRQALSSQPPAARGRGHSAKGPGGQGGDSG